MLDAVIVHELAHLIEPNHSPRFNELEQPYPRSDADVFLEGYALGWHMPDASDCTVKGQEPGDGRSEVGPTVPTGNDATG